MQGPRFEARLGVLLGISLLLAAMACDERSGVRDGGARDGAGDDGLGAGDVMGGGLSVDFTTANCPTAFDADAGVPRGCCRGPAPLSLSFVPLVAGPVDRYLWQFGDETASALAAPSHLYPIPNRYDVTLVVGGPAGTLSRSKRGCVEVTTNEMGRPCDFDGQCTPGTTCVCGAAAECPSPFDRGICSASCQDNPCPAPSVCGDLSLGGSPTAMAPWRRPLCLAPCEVDGDCASGLRCRSLPSRFPAGRWVRACFAPFPLPIGTPCRNARGQLEGASCSSGLCVDRGALGQCSADCSQGTCPAGTACAMFANGDRLCVPTCSSRFRCQEDPLLSCQQSGGSGPLAFTVADPAEVSAAYCTPRPCLADGDCPSGTCLFDGTRGHCRAR